MTANKRTCSRCVYDDRVPGIKFDSAGVCNYCRTHDIMSEEYPLGDAGAQRLATIVERIKAAGRGRKYDCVVGVSGGCDSSWMLVKMVELGLRPLAVHFDNTWNSPIATQNIYNVLERLGVELSTLVVNAKEYDDIYRSFLKAGVKDVEAPTDIGLAATLYRAADEHGIKYIIEGHSFRTEGIAPSRMDIHGRTIYRVRPRQVRHAADEDVPNLTLSAFLRWAAIDGIKRIRPLYYMDYDKAAARQLLTSDFGWVWHGGHHLENRSTAFWHTYFLPRRYASMRGSLATRPSSAPGRWTVMQPSRS